MKIWNDLKRVFRRLTPLEMAAQELLDAELSKLEADSAREYAEAISRYNEARAKRLREFIQTQSKA